MDKDQVSVCACASEYLPTHIIISAVCQSSLMYMYMYMYMHKFKVSYMYYIMHKHVLT